jgi:hypothetical protein
MSGLCSGQTHDVILAHGTENGSCVHTSHTTAIPGNDQRRTFHPCPRQTLLRTIIT